MKALRQVILAGLLLLSAVQPAHGLAVAVVQIRIDESTFVSLESFRASVTAAVQEALREPRPARPGAHFLPELIVFPEYTAVFLAFLPYQADLRGASSVADGLSRVRAAHPGIPGLREVFLEQSAVVQGLVADVFGGLARKHGVAIIAGSAFVRAQPAGGPSQVRNRAFVFGPDGGLLYAQDKVFLTDFELEVAGLSPGNMTESAPFVVAGTRIGLTLCRDTFFPGWEELFRDRVDLWIDIKANGETFTEDERANFQKALPSRLPGAGVRRGITACLVGRYLDLIWEGESSVIECVDGTVRTVAAVSSPRSQEILVVGEGTMPGSPLQ